MSMKKSIRVSVDLECNPEEFWQAVGDNGGGSFSDPVAELLRGNALELSQIEWDQLRSWMSKFAGWNTEIEHAPHPVVVSEIK